MNRRKSTNQSASPESTDQLFERAWQLIDDSKNAIVEFRRYQQHLARRHDDFEGSLPEWEKSLATFNGHRGSLPWPPGEWPQNGRRENSRTHNGTGASKRNGNK